MVKALAWVGMLILQFLVPWQIIAVIGEAIHPTDWCRSCGREPNAGNGYCPKCDAIRRDALEERCEERE